MQEPFRKFRKMLTWMTTGEALWFDAGELDFYFMSFMSCLIAWVISLQYLRT